MSRLIKKAIVSLLILSLSATMLVQNKISVTVFAADNNGAISIPFIVQERSGVSVKDYFFRRGVAFEKGLLYSPENICLVENGKQITSAAEVLETYEDGSIKWLLVSGNINLKEKELKKLTLTNGQVKKGKTTYKKGNKTIKVDSEKVDFILGSKGIESLKYNGAEQLNELGINLYATIGGKTNFLNVDKFEVLKHTDSYSKFKISGKIFKNLDGEIVITLAEGASKIQVDHRIIAKDYLDVEKTGLRIGKKYSDGKVGYVVDSDFIDLGTMQLATFDNTRFNGAVGSPENTGYVICENYVQFAPFVNETPFTYYDGNARTCHLYITFDNDEENWAKQLSMPPKTGVDSEQYVRAGQILTTIVSPVVTDYIKLLTTGNEAVRGQVGVGGMTSYNPIDGDVVITQNWPGELEYNFGKGYMQTADEDLWRYMFDLSEARCDFVVYKGMHEDIQGLLKYRWRTSSTDQSHAYYSDEGGLYMTYVLTGDEYVYEWYKKGIYKTLEDTFTRGTFGSHHVEYWYWGGIGDPYLTPWRGQFVESRGMIRARTLYLASNLFHDSRFKDAAYAIVEWAENVQLDDGDFTQVNMHNWRQTYQTIPEGRKYQLPRKNYVNLMGFRGVSELLDFESNEKTLEVVKKYADHLIWQGENFGSVLMNPHSDINIYEVNEDDTRQMDCRINIMAIDVLCTAFENTKDEKYLLWICKFLEAYVASSVSGAGAVADDKGYLKNLRQWGYEAMRNPSFLRTSDNLSVIFRDYREKIEELGFEQLAMVFSEGAESLGQYAKSNIKLGYVTNNVYQLDGTKVMYAMNIIPENASNDDETWEQNVQMTFNEMMLWQGVTNSIKSPYAITLEKTLDHKEYMYGIQRPIYIEDFVGTAEAEVLEYSKDKIMVSLKGKYEAEIRIKTGKFVIEDNKGYNVGVSSKNGSTILVVSQNGALKPQNGEIIIKINDDGKLIDEVGASVLDSTFMKNIPIDAKLDKHQLADFVEEYYGVKIELNSEFPTWEEFSEEFVGALAVSNKKTLTDAGLRIVEEGTVNPNISDDQAVKFASQALKIEYKGEKLKSDVFLTEKSLHNTSVSWKSSRPDILSAEGVLNRANIDCDVITMTAVVTKGSAVCERIFTIPLDREIDVSMKFTQNYNPEINMQGLVQQKGKFEMTFTLTPNFEKMDAIVSIGSSEKLITANSNIPYCVRFYSNGKIDAYDLTGYSSENEVPYEIGKKYKIRMVVDIDEEKYDVYVTPEGGSEIVIAKDYRKRSISQPVEMIDQIWGWSTTVDALTIEDISIINPRKADALDVFVYDYTGKKFNPYTSLNGYSFETFSRNGRVVNWQTVNSHAEKNGEYVTVHIGAERITAIDLSLMDVLRDAKILKSDVKDNDFVTPKSLVRPLNLK